MGEETKKMHHQDDVNPGAEQDKIESVRDNEKNENAPLTTGTGGLPAVPRTESLVIKKDE